MIIANSSVILFFRETVPFKYKAKGHHDAFYNPLDIRDATWNRQIHLGIFSKMLN